MESVVCLCLLFILIIWIPSQSLGSQIIFTGQPTVLKTPLTKSLTMRCSLNDTVTMTTARSDVTFPDITKTVENMKVLTSLVISRDNTTVALVITGQPPRALADLDIIEVKGQVGTNGTPGEQGYVELTWNQPTKQQTGTYRCEVNTISALGNNVIFSSTLPVDETTASCSDLMSVIKVLQQDNIQMEKTITALTANLTEMSKLTTDPPVLTSNVTGPQIETGRLECTDSDIWGRDSVKTWAQSQTITKPFQTTFLRPPHVHVSVVSIDHEQGENVRYDVTVQRVSKDSFAVKCLTWGGSKIYHLFVDYMAISG